jgi:hypothetical protein
LKHSARPKTCPVSPRGGGSHFKVSHAAIPEILTIPYKRPIKPVYIRRLVHFVDAVRRIADKDHRL